MLFTVVESRDARLVAESADRSLKLTLEGPGAPAFAVGMTLELDGTIPAVEVLAVGQPAPVEVTHDLSDEEKRDFGPLTVSAEEMAEIAATGRFVEIPLAEPAPDQ